MHISTKNISQMVTDRDNIAIANTEGYMWPFNWHVHHLTLAHSKDQGQKVKVIRISIVNISQMMTDRTSIDIANS